MVLSVARQDASDIVNQNQKENRDESPLGGADGAWTIGILVGDHLVATYSAVPRVNRYRLLLGKAEAYHIILDIRKETDSIIQPMHYHYRHNPSFTRALSWDIPSPQSPTSSTTTPPGHQAVAVSPGQSSPRARQCDGKASRDRNISCWKYRTSRRGRRQIRQRRRSTEAR